MESCTLRLDAGAGALLAELAVDVFGSLAQEVQRRDLLVGAVVLHRGLAHGLHADGLGVTWRRDGGRGAGPGREYVLIIFIYDFLRLVAIA